MLCCTPSKTLKDGNKMDHTTDVQTEQRGRGLTLDGKKAFVKLDSASWKAIDMIAAANGIEWADWVRAVWQAITDKVGPGKIGEINRAGFLRAAAISHLVTWVETQGAMLRHYMDIAGATDRVELPLANGFSLVVDKAHAQNLSEKIAFAMKC